MKSILVSLSIVLVLFTSCSKKAPDVVPNALVGTTWINIRTINGTYFTDSIKFVNNSSFTEFTTGIGVINTVIYTSGTYTYTYPVGTITVTSGAAAGSSNTFTVNDNSFYCNSINGTTPLTYTKQ